ncbi:hypothetical protein Bbelb_272730 [Branchiostoma belcheri]|nr:hypothetical protein Bbelb_272730 [Branchiostoma belcheri]
MFCLDSYENWGEEEEDAYEYFDDVEKDPDYVPSVTMRTSSTILGRDIETYGVITPGEEVYDHALSVGVADETDDNIEFPDEIKVNHSGDIKDEQCSIVYTKSLLQLVEFLQQPADKMKCRDPKCSATGQPNPVSKSIGTGIVLKWYCGCGHLIWKWHSQPRFKYGLQAGDFMLSSSILLSGNNYSKVSLMSSFMNLGCVCETTFLRVQRQYCVPVIETFWQRKLQALVREMKRRDKVVLLGITTSDLESFQNHILMYASKRYAFSPPVYEARCQLAALDYNEHKDRAVWKAKDGHIKYKRRFQKKSERWSIYVPREPNKYLYIKDLQAEIVDKIVDSGRGMSTTQPMSETDPRRLGTLAKIPPVPTNVLVEQHRSRTDLPTQGSLTA